MLVCRFAHSQVSRRRWFRQSFGITIAKLRFPAPLAFLKCCVVLIVGSPVCAFHMEMKKRSSRFRSPESAEPNKRVCLLLILIIQSC